MKQKQSWFWDVICSRSQPIVPPRLDPAWYNFRAQSHPCWWWGLDILSRSLGSGSKRSFFYTVLKWLFQRQLMHWDLDRQQIHPWQAIDPRHLWESKHQKELVFTVCSKGLEKSLARDRNFTYICWTNELILTRGEWKARTAFSRTLRLDRNSGLNQHHKSFPGLKTGEPRERAWWSVPGPHLPRSLLTSGQGICATIAGCPSKYPSQMPPALVNQRFLWPK